MKQCGSSRQINGRAVSAIAPPLPIVGESLADVAREALKIARVESQSRPVLLVDLLGQGSALDEMFADDDLHGVSDAARYGVSLGAVARPVPNADSLFVVPGGHGNATGRRRVVRTTCGDRGPTSAVVRAHCWSSPRRLTCTTSARRSTSSTAW